MLTLKLVKSEKVQEAFLSSVKKFGKASGVCVLLTKPYSVFELMLRKRGVNPKELFFIDTLAESEQDNVVHAASGNLTALSITINQALQSMPDKDKFLVFDSISTLAVHSSPNAVSKFALFLIEHIRQWKVNAVIIAAAESTDKELLSILKQSCDKVETK
jgi:KaiC/GvpD/RAD55 family RecA-like ATPase